MPIRFGGVRGISRMTLRDRWENLVFWDAPFTDTAFHRPWIQVLEPRFTSIARARVKSRAFDGRINEVVAELVKSFITLPVVVSFQRFGTVHVSPSPLRPLARNSPDGKWMRRRGQRAASDYTGSPRSHKNTTAATEFINGPSSTEGQFGGLACSFSSVCEIFVPGVSIHPGEPS